MHFTALGPTDIVGQTERAHATLMQFARPPTGGIYDYSH